jgi:hypothetical protein
LGLSAWTVAKIWVTVLFEPARQVINTTLIEKSERQLASLRSEIRIMRELHHPHIATLQKRQ